MWPYTQKMIKFLSSPEFIRFFVVGFTAFLLDFGLLNFQIYVLHFNVFVGIVSISNVISVCTAIVYGFILQRNWAFKTHDQDAVKQGSKYLGVALASMVLNNILYGLLILLGIIPPVAKFLVSGAQMAWNYVLYKYFVFKK